MRQKNECQKRLANEIMDHLDTQAKLKKSTDYNKKLNNLIKELDEKLKRLDVE